MLKAFKNHINQNLSFLTESKLLIAISGGLDSVILTHLCKALNLNITLAHCNFNLRGEESNADEDFVIQLTDDLNIEAFIQNFETEVYAKTHKLSTQMAARELRYNWFHDLATQLKFDYILTAHHTDDNLETFLINLSRGTGLDGLTGIPETNEKIVRPLLQFSREDIEEYAKAEKLKWREDRSNASTKYLRNKLRHDVIPILKEINPQLLQNFNKTIENLQDSAAIIDDRIDAVSDTIITKVNKNEIHFDISQIQTSNNPKAYLYQLLKDFNFTEWNDIYNLLEAQSGKQIFSKTHRLVKDRKHLLLSKTECDVIQNDSEESLIIEEHTKQFQTPFGILFFDEADAIFGKRANVIHIDKSKLSFPLTIRKWKKGDYFHPFGMQGKKKLSKFFKDEKLSLLDKENIWLLCSKNDVVWIINKRADNRFKVTENTKQILKIELK